EPRRGGLAPRRLGLRAARLLPGDRRGGDRAGAARRRARAHRPRGRRRPDRPLPGAGPRPARRRGPVRRRPVRRPARHPRAGRAGPRPGRHAGPNPSPSPRRRMTATADATATRVPPRRRLLVWAVIVLAVALVGAVLAGLRGPNTLPLDPDNPEDGGMQAIARVLEQRGVEVEVARSLADLRSTTVDGSTRVLVVGTAFLSPDSGRQVLEHVRGADALLVLRPGRNTGEVLDLPRSEARRVGQE